MRSRYLAVALVLSTLAACSSTQYSGKLPENQPPHVWLSAAPPEGSVDQYTVHLYWGGWDPDGKISHYEYFISDNTTGMFNPADTVGVKWPTVFANDSTFVFSADSLAVPNPTSQVSVFERSHTFFIRAVDDQGMHSIRPAHRSFTARTLSPEVKVKVPVRNQLNPADLPPIATYRWEATDYVNDTQSSQDPDSVQWALVSTAPHGGSYEKTIDYLRTPAAASEWYPWVYYKAPQDSGKFWTTPPTEFGNYIFAIRAKDEAGAVTPVLDEINNVRRVRVTRRTTGPKFTLSSLYLGQVVTTSCSTPITILDLPAGVPVDFTLSATADFYGGTVAGYRYGWDISDLNDPTQWETDYTPFVTSKATTPSRRFFFGTHTFTAEVIDNSGFCARVTIKVNIVQFTLERNLLIVDDFKADEGSQAGWDNPVGLGSLPNDAEHDAFWQDMVKNLDGFDPARDMVSVDRTSGIPLTKLAQYKSIIWDVYSDVAQTSFPLLYTFIQYRPQNADQGSTTSGKVTPDLISLTMSAGGHILLVGAQPVQNVINRIPAPRLRYPVIWLYELEGNQDGSPNIDNPVGAESFAYDELCLETLDFGNLTSQRGRAYRGSLRNYCPVNHVRTTNNPRTDTMREAIPIDTRFPALHLRPETAGPGKFYNEANLGLDAEVYNPQYFADLCPYVPDPRPCFQPIYGMGCLDTQEKTYDQPVAFFTSAYADHVAEVPGAVGARSAVFGFEPAFFNPDEVRPAIEVIMFDEWKLPRKSNVTTTARR